MSFRSLSGLPINIRSLNGLEGVAIEQIIAGDAISVLDNSKAKKTINVNISKQTAVTTVADDDIFLLEDSSGAIKKITGLNLKDAADGFFFKNNNDIFADEATNNLVLGSISTSVNSGGYKLYILGTSFFSDAITSDALSTFNKGLAVKYTPSDDVSGFVRIFDKDASHRIDLHAGGTAMSIASNKNQYLPDATGTIALLESLSATAPIVYNNSTGAFTFDNSSTAYISLTSLSASAPIVYSNTTGAFTFDNTSTAFISLTSLSASSPLVYNDSTGAFTTTFTPTSTTNMSGKTFTDMPVCNIGIAVKQTADTTSGNVRFFDKDNSNHIDLHVQDHTVASNINVFLPNSVNNTILVGRDTADTLTNKTITSFTGNSSATITTPSSSGTLALQNEIWTESGASDERVITPSNTNVRHLEVFNTGSIRNQLNGNQKIVFTRNSGASDEMISILSTLVEVEGKICNSSNNAYFLSIGNGVLESSMTQIKIPEDSYIINAGDTTNDYIQFKADILYVNYNQIDLKSGASSAKIRNATTTTNYIQLDTTYGLFVNLNCKVAGDIFNCADNRLQIEEVGSNARVHFFDPQGTDNGATLAGAYISYHQNGTELHLNAPNDVYDNTLSQNIKFSMAGDTKVQVNGLARESLTFHGNTNVTLSGTKYHQYGSVGMTEGGVFGSNLGSAGLSGLATPNDSEFMGFFGGNLNNTEGFCVMSNADLMFISNAGNGGVALQYIDEDEYPSTSPRSWTISDTGNLTGSSDSRIKTSVNTFKKSDFEKYKKIRTITYKLKESEFPSEERKKDPKYGIKYNNIHFGVIAQELYDLYPELETSVGINERKEWKNKKQNWKELYPKELEKWNKRKLDFDKSNGKEKKEFRVSKPTENFDIEEPMRSVDYNRISLLTVGVVQQLIETVEKQQEQISSLKNTIDKLNASKTFKEFKM